MAEHSQLTGADLHEPKGVATASAGTVYTADGSGSGTWTNLFAGLIQKNTQLIVTTFNDITVGSDIYFFVPHNAVLNRLAVTLYGSITGADDTIYTYVNGNLRTETLTIPASGSAAGVTSNLFYTGTSQVTGGSVVRINSDGAPTNTTAVRADVQLEIMYI